MGFGVDVTHNCGRPSAAGKGSDSADSANPCQLELKSHLGDVFIQAAAIISRPAAEYRKATEARKAPWHHRHCIGISPLLEACSTVE